MTLGSYWLHDLPQVLGGLANVSTYSGWETRSRSSGGYDKVLGIAVHHTASNTSPESDMKYQWVTCSDGPVGAIYLGRDGRIVIGAAGATNCQGKGGPLNCSTGQVPKDKGNQYMIAIEAANAGTGEPWPQVQTDQYVALVQALCAYGLDANRDVYGHFDYCAPSCPGRKIDPAGPSPFGTVNANQTWDINQFRGAVLGAPPQPGPTPPPSGGNWYDDLMAQMPTLTPGSDNYWYVKRMQHLLASAGFMNEANVNNYDGQFGNGTANALNNFKVSAGGSADNTCDPWTWGALMHTIDGIPVLIKGMSGADVKRMQHLLAANGYMNEANTSNYDGKWGNGTEQAKVNYDNAAGLTPSPPSDCGSKSWTYLLTV